MKAVYVEDTCRCCDAEIKWPLHCASMARPRCDYCRLRCLAARGHGNAVKYEHTPRPEELGVR